MPQDICLSFDPGGDHPHDPLREKKKTHTSSFQMLLFGTAELSDQKFMKMKSFWLATDPNRSVPIPVHG